MTLAKSIFAIAAPALALGWTMAATSAAQAAPERVVPIDTRPGITMSFVVVEPAAGPIASVILFSGGTGKVKLWRRKPPNLNKNFLVRSRQLFAGHGFLTVVVDVASDQRKDGLIGIRDSTEHRRDIAAVIAWLRNEASAPVWLIGTSRGTISAAHLAATTRIEGAVLTAIVTDSSTSRPATALDAKLEDITVPVLLVNHRDDECHVTPSNNLHMVANRLTKSPKIGIMKPTGGSAGWDSPCSAMTHHGFLGIEARVVGDIAGWIKARLRP